MKIYHYTSFYNIGSILGKQRGEPAGLQPRRGIGLAFSSLDNPKAIFGLLEPTPDSWVNNTHFQATWKVLEHDLRVGLDGALLLEVDLNPNKDKAFVAERAHLEGILYDEKEGIPNQFLHGHQNEAERAFIESMTPLNEYTARQHAGATGFSLPEVIILNPIAPERIAVASHQPLIEADLARSRGVARQHLVCLITDGWAQSELSAWRKTYEGKHGRLEQQLRSKEAL